jgi:hypothetical protein
LQVLEDRLESLPSWLPFGMLARLHQVAEGYQVTAPTTARFVAPPDLRRMVWLNRQCPIPCFSGSAAVEKAAHSDFVANAAKLRQLDTVVRGGLLQAHLGNEFLDVDKTRFLLPHAV